MTNIPKLYKVVISGDRTRKREYVLIVQREIKALREKQTSDSLLIIAGGEKGVDEYVELVCKRLNVHCAVVKALWDTRGRPAGPQRNKVMAALEPHEVIGIHDDISISKGTKGMLKLAEDLGIPYRLVES
jgi:hypothetical protein